ncbi:hypothetical protein JCM10450v2_001474 [Rhodotorula kratochvilovae]
MDWNRPPPPQRPLPPPHSSLPPRPPSPERARFEPSAHWLSSQHDAGSAKSATIEPRTRSERGRPRSPAIAELLPPRWTVDEELALHKAVERHGTQRWDAVQWELEQARFAPRTVEAIKQHYWLHALLELDGATTGQIAAATEPQSWTPRENAVLLHQLDLVSESDGPLDWLTILAKLPSRTRAETQQQVGYLKRQRERDERSGRADKRARLGIKLLSDAAPPIDATSSRTSDSAIGISISVLAQKNEPETQGTAEYSATSSSSRTTAAHSTSAPAVPSPPTVLSFLPSTVRRRCSQASPKGPNLVPNKPSAFTRSETMTDSSPSFAWHDPSIAPPSSTSPSFSTASSAPGRPLQSTSNAVSRPSDPAPIPDTPALSPLRAPTAKQLREAPRREVNQALRLRGYFRLRKRRPWLSEADEGETVKATAARLAAVLAHVSE